MDTVKSSNGANLCFYIRLENGDVKGMETSNFTVEYGEGNVSSSKLLKGKSLKGSFKLPVKSYISLELLNVKETDILVEYKNKLNMDVYASHIMVNETFPTGESWGWVLVHGSGGTLTIEPTFIESSDSSSFVTARFNYTA